METRDQQLFRIANRYFERGRQGRDPQRSFERAQYYLSRIEVLNDDVICLTDEVTRRLELYEAPRT